MVAELIRGVPLEAWTKGECRMSWPEQRRVAEGLLAALGAVHGAGVIHRDVKPANVLVEEGTGRVLLIDFNVASVEQAFAGEQGTRLYRAPDVGQVGWTSHADLFALGIVLFELFFGGHPFVDLPLGGAARSPRSMVGFAAVSDATVAFFSKALQPRAEHRFVWASEMLAALPKDLFASAVVPVSVAPPSQAEAVAAAPIAVSPPQSAPVVPLETAARRSPLSRSLVAGLSLLLGGAGWAVWAGLGDRDEAPPVAPAPLPVPESADAKFDHRGCPEGFVRIPAGSFRMGREVWEKPGYKDESPVHTVVLTRDICMQQRESDQRAWASLMGSNPSVHSGCGETCPVDSVTWRDAIAFANARSTAEGRPACYEGDRLLGFTCGGYRLPTEAEWEYAYRAGSTTSLYNGDATTDAGVDPLAELIATYIGNVVRSRPSPVGQRLPNAWGLYDMAGNVQEWVEDRYLARLPAATDPLQLTGSLRVMRGGFYNASAAGIRAAYRIKFGINLRDSATGFRLVRTVTPANLR